MSSGCCRVKGVEIAPTATDNDRDSVIMTGGNDGDSVVINLSGNDSDSIINNGGNDGDSIINPSGNGGDSIIINTGGKEGDSVITGGNNDVGPETATASGIVPLFLDGNLPGTSSIEDGLGGNGGVDETSGSSVPVVETTTRPSATTQEQN